MTAQHTPGPWIISPSHDAAPFMIGAPGHDRGVHVASVYTAADAAVIAAAPDMLALLDEALGELLADETRDGPRCLLITRMEALIARAEGRA